MTRSKGEYYFEYRVRNLLSEEGWLVIKCASSRPYDIIAIKKNVAIPIEIKHKDGYYPKDQEEKQIDLGQKTQNNYLLLWQSNQRGKIEYKKYNIKEDEFYNKLLRSLLLDLGMENGRLLKLD
ncbi:MAG: hypothetical protein ACLFVP_07250 [Candidatus Bathyarchaeia archaeon]